jgi:CheY-like chemotaxis protein
MYLEVGRMKRILVIEDSVEFREYISEVLRLCGFALDEAPGAAQAIFLAHQTHHDLILCDLHLPEVDGLSLMKAIQDGEGQVPFVVLSADGRESQIRRGMQFGAEAYMVKPVAINDLVAIVRRCVEKLPQAA